MKGKLGKVIDSPYRATILLVVFVVVLIVLLMVTGHGGPAYDETR